MHKKAVGCFSFSRYSTYITWQMTFQVMGCICFFLFLEGPERSFGISTATAAIVAVAAEDFIFAFAFSFILHGYSFALVFAFSWFYTSSLPLAIFLWFFGVGLTNIASVFVSWDGVNFIVFTFHVNKVAKTTIQPIWVIFSQWIVLCLCPVVYVYIGRCTLYIADGT